ncbi:MAG: tRNA epoxyqueuosine(34) reductase QueG [Hyphomicrobiaceae bacterium]
MPRSNEEKLRDDAQAYGFDAVGIARPDAIGPAGERLQAFITRNWHGEMAWLAHTADRRSSPLALWPACRSVIMLAMNYGPANDPLERLEERDRGIIAAYAKGRDYHDLVKGRLKQIASRFAARTGAEVKVFVDTAPLMEKPLAQAAGLGWIGKHTNLVSRERGSWLFLGAILTTAELQASESEADHCGNCRRCLDVCPTNAFPTAYQLDARRCIAYLTIEYSGHIAHEFRRAIGNRVFGCDDCLAVCPWNKFAEHAGEMKFHAREQTDDPPLEELVELDDRAFRDRFSGTPVKRTGRDRLVRNVLIALGNSGNEAKARLVERRLGDDSPLVRAMAVWALSQLVDGKKLAALAPRYQSREKDPHVSREWSLTPAGQGDNA